jgi:16S rRNA processing protein RimM
MIELVTIGVVVNTHGHLGEVRIKPLTDYPERFKTMKTLKIYKNKEIRELTIKGLKDHNGMIIARFDEINDMNQAIEIKGSEIKVNRDEVVQLPPDHFFVFDLIGLAVYTIDNEYLGLIDEVIETGANDVYIIKKPGSKDILIPALKKLVHEVNLEDKKMIVELMEGLID